MKQELKYLKNHLEIAKAKLEELGPGPCKYSCLEKRVLARTGTFTIVNTIRYFLRDEGYVSKVGSENRASYSISPTGEKLLEALL